jgi:rhamnose transport system ATP-binding protein
VTVSPTKLVVADRRRSAETHIAVRGIGKRYDGVVALDGVSIEFARGSIHALVGENGAGKSTLGKVVAGAVLPDAGHVEVLGRRVHLQSPRDALGHGMALVHQEISLVPSLSVLDNVFLGVEPTRTGFLAKAAQRRRFREMCDETGFELDPARLVRELRVGDQQKVEILRALVRGADAIVFDEPTATLTRQEAEHLYDVLRMLQDRGTTVIYVSHFLHEVLALADAVSVLRDGRLVHTSPAAGETVDSLITGMLGGSLDAAFPSKRPVPDAAPVVLRAVGVTRKGVVEDVSLSVRAGEIVGLAGLVGSGRTELARLIFGADRRDSGDIDVCGKSASIRTPRAAVDAGLAFVPENRKEQGVLLRASARENLTISHLNRYAAFGLLRRGRESTAAREIAEKVGLRPPALERAAATFSGGNQQKLVFGRWLSGRPSVLIADEPTRGVDVGAKLALYELLQSMAADGMGVLLISSELEELTGLAHRILVMRSGRLVAELPGDASDGEVLSAAFGEHMKEITA